MPNKGLSDYQQGYADALSQARAFIDQKLSIACDRGVSLGLKKALNIIDGLLHAPPAV